MQTTLNKRVHVAINVWKQYSVALDVYSVADIYFKRSVERQLLIAQLPCEPMVSTMVWAAVMDGVIEAID